ncbi:putative tRNA pseudouridine synthase [Scenedesmus sp. NREL 46B-D3]|nr:putative tRNA pseudouridine synthase [Scenedesmus sp. NREL 46B-D3]
MLAQQAAAASQQLPTVVTRLPEQFNAQVLANAVLLIDKPPRWSSTDVVRELKRTLRLQKVCHGGPLDAHATGLLIVLMGAASRLTPKLEPLERTYSGTLKLGAATTTYDATGQATQTSPWRHISDADLATAAVKFQGEVLQVPCMWSSTKYRNRPLRWYAERGEEVRREPKAVHISSMQLQARSDEVHFRVVASKGASMRVLAHDLGATLGCGAHLLRLRREAIGGFKVDTAWSLEVLLPLATKYGKGYKFVQPA